MSSSYIFILIFLLARIVISLNLILIKSVYFLPLTKVMQIISLYTQRNFLSILALIVDYTANMFMVVQKEKRKLNFDSRLENKYLAGKISAVYLLMLITYLTNTTEIHRNPSSVLFCSLIYYSFSCLDPLYSYRSKEILKTIALIPIFLSFYFLLLPFIPTLNDFNLSAHHFLTSLIFVTMVFYAN